MNALHDERAVVIWYVSSAGEVTLDWRTHEMQLRADRMADYLWRRLLRTLAAQRWGSCL